MKKNSLTVIFMRDTNRPLTFELSIKLIILLVIVLIGFGFTYAYFLGGYRSLKSNNIELEAKVRALKYKISQLEGEIGRLSTHKNTRIEQSQPETEKTVSEVPPAPIKLVDIENLSLRTQPNSGRLEYIFNLINTTDDEQMVRGYVFIVLRNKNNPQYYRSDPSCSFENDKPVNFRLGDPYAIKRFKEYRGVLTLDEQSNVIEILVYSEDGDIILTERKEI